MWAETIRYSLVIIAILICAHKFGSKVLTSTCEGLRVPRVRAIAPWHHSSNSGYLVGWSINLCIFKGGRNWKIGHHSGKVVAATLNVTIYIPTLNVLSVIISHNALFSIITWYCIVLHIVTVNVGNISRKHLNWALCCDLEITVAICYNGQGPDSSHWSMCRGSRNLCSGAEEGLVVGECRTCK